MTAVDVSTIEHLDFDYEPPCVEHCDTPADYATKWRCVSCGETEIAYVCDRHWRDVYIPVLPLRCFCNTCGHVATYQETLVEQRVIRS